MDPTRKRMVVQTPPDLLDPLVAEMMMRRWLARADVTRTWMDRFRSVNRFESHDRRAL